MTRITVYRWVRRLMWVFFGFVLLILFVVLPVGGSFLITNTRFRFPERGPQRAEEVGLKVVDVGFKSADGIALKGWFDPGEPSMPVIIFVHGLNRSRLELLEPAAQVQRNGYGVLLFDMRNHGQSGDAYTTLGVHESMDVCAASAWTHENAAGRPQVLWGVSMGAASALLGARRCPGFAAIVSDSAFLSFRETIGHHFNLIFRLPAFPIANAIVGLTGMRVGFDPDEGDVEAAVRDLGSTPILFVTGTEDVRMPPQLAERLYRASSSPRKELLIVDGAGHGDAYEVDPQTYLDRVFAFLKPAR